ncbi:MAG: GNAT family N-acetyltransferase [Candidatus Lokiarchaeota archaeon]|nr:GNAT family N-acetyltransferase [Candidatus Lokiarchaeota archaeon]
MMNFTITNNLDDPRIVDFLIKDERATIYHHPAWLKALGSSYNFSPYYLLVLNNETNEIKGIAPFVMDNPKSNNKKKIISLPFTNYCNFILPENIDLNLILKEIESEFGYISEYDFRNLDDEIIPGFSNSNVYLVHTIELKPTVEETYKSFGRRSIRRFIKKAEENNLSFRFGETEEDLKIFYHLEVKLRKNIGLPPAPYRFFYNIWKYLKEQGLIYLPIVEYNSKAIAASLVLHFKDQIYFEYTGISKIHKNLYGNHKLHWEMIKIAQSELGVTLVGLGRTAIDNKQLIFFKEHWNAKPHNVYHKKSPPISDSIGNSKILKYIYPIYKTINRHLPEKVLELEGKLLYKYLRIIVFCVLFS